MNEKTTPLKRLNISFNLKSFITTLSFLGFIITQNTNTLEAKEPLLAILQKIYSNSMQKVGIGNSSYICKAYGIVSLDEIYFSAKADSLCTKSIDDFYKSHPKNQYFTNSILRVGQKYHIEFIAKNCILYAKGETTLSEYLLKGGLASVVKKFKNPEYSDAFKKDENRAKEERKGLWNKDISLNCLAQKQKFN